MSVFLRFSLSVSRLCADSALRENEESRSDVRTFGVASKRRKAIITRANGTPGRKCRAARLTFPFDELGIEIR